MAERKSGGQNRQCAILWLSFLPPRKSPQDAGTQSFSYYYYAMCNDSRFRVKLLASVFEDLDKTESENNDNDHKYFFAESSSVIQRLQNIESTLNPYTRYAGLLSNFLVHEILVELNRLRDEGYLPDIVVLEWTSMVVLAEQVKAIFPKSKLVATEQDVAFVGLERWSKYPSDPFRRWFRETRAKVEKRIEVNSLKLCDLIIPMNADNGELLVREGVCKSKIWGMSPYYHSMMNLERNGDDKTILFFGAMNRSENVLSVKWFVDKVMPRLDDLNVRFVILGSKPTDEVMRLESERVHVTGYVECVDCYFSRCACVVVPLVLGAGIKIKVLEALSAGAPTLSNAIGIEGIHAEDGDAYLHCETPEEFADGVRKIILDHEFAYQLSCGSRAFMRDNFSYEKSLEEYKNRILGLCSDLN
jgi:glycosyltransferase involved in cell wall biosynthesis